ncbi:MAG: 50S ribosomal protein L29 [Proteobacteria bacterium]|nr:50S ribosomal protein L29 [Pseudomonadota bacterium]
MNKAVTEIRERKDEELGLRADQLREDMFRQRVRQATNQLQDTSTLPKLRRELAQTLTVKRARELGIEQKK